MSPHDRAQVIAQLEMHEAVRLKPYVDTTGHITIGVGRNLTDVGISYDEALYLLGHDLDPVVAALERLDWYQRLDPVRQRVVVDMAFNLGVEGLLRFETTLASIARGDYTRAAAEMLQSRWARQVKTRAARLALMMRTGADA